MHPPNLHKFCRPRTYEKTENIDIVRQRLTVQMQLPGTKVVANIGFKVKQVIGHDYDLLAQLAFLLRNFLERGHFFHLGVCEELAGNSQRWKRQPFLQRTGNMSQVRVISNN